MLELHNPGGVHRGPRRTEVTSRTISAPRERLSQELGAPAVMGPLGARDSGSRGTRGPNRVFHIGGGWKSPTVLPSESEK